jgi:CheY-like chemotaxis protein
MIDCSLIVNGSSRMNESILFVEDEADLLELFSLGLRKLNRPIVTAHNGDEAMAILQEDAPAIIILDIGIPYPSGLDLLHFIRSDPRYDETKIIIFTAAPSRVSQADAELANAMLVKPTTPRVLEQTIINLLGA